VVAEITARVCVPERDKKTVVEKKKGGGEGKDETARVQLKSLTRQLTVRAGKGKKGKTG